MNYDKTLDKVIISLMIHSEQISHCTLNFRHLLYYYQYQPMFISP